MMQNEKRIHNKMKCMKELYDGIKFCMKCEEEEVTDFMGQKRIVRQGYSLSLYLFNDFRENTVYISKDN
jgi:hypothetical protein